MYQNMLVSLQEVVWGPAGNHWFSSARAGVELQAVIKLVGRRMAEGFDIQSVLEMLVDLHDSRLVATSVTVVWCCTCKHRI